MTTIKEFKQTVILLDVKNGKVERVRHGYGLRRRMRVISRFHPIRVRRLELDDMIEWRAVEGEGGKEKAFLTDYGSLMLEKALEVKP